ncbi:MAG: sigma factor-like helix-turn-helix DNA-binding protein [Candidatus Caldarchaeales archaeon]
MKVEKVTKSIELTEMLKVEFQELTIRLNTIISLLAISLPMEFNQQEKIELLSRLGLTPKEIAKILGTTNNTVNVALTRARRGRKLIAKKNPK